MRKTTVSIIGLGKIGMMYDYEKNLKKFTLSHVNSIIKNRRFKLISVIDNDLSKIKRFEKKYKSNCFRDINSAFKKEIPDLVIISTPTDSHLSDIKKLVTYKKIKFFLCEKPLSYKIQESLKIINLCKKNKKKLFINYYRNFDRNFIKSIPYIKKQLGKISNGTVYYAKGIFNNGSHYLAILERIFGAVKKVEIIKKGKKIKNDYEPEFKLIFKKNKSIIHFIPVDEKNFSYYEMIFFGQKGLVRLNRYNENIKIMKKAKDNIYKNYSSIIEFKDFYLNRYNPQYEVLNSLNKIISGKINIKNFINIDQNVKVLDMIKKKLTK